MMEHTLKVEALENGTVIDHIPAGQGRRNTSHRIDEGDEYFQQLRGRWASGLRQVFASLPDPEWFDEA